ncbi:next to BRCA1 gene 1 protein-like, partial [Notothenia coriiceps]|uniref:Next to BRCA1 gene 1 protein-like n=1 Tax=Notothenia coriiceps TaxID=8208 RepID=A0A6I9PGU8_9TELE
ISLVHYRSSLVNLWITLLICVVFGQAVKLRQQKEQLEPLVQEEDREEEISGAQFLCETVIRSLTLEEAPDHRPLRRALHSSHKPQIMSRGTSFCLERVVEAEQTTETVQEGSEEICAVRLESSALPVNTGLNQITEEEETRPVLQEPANENLHTSSHHDIENEEVIDDMQNMAEIQEEKEEGGTKGEDWEEVSSQTSSVSSCDDYIIILPDCFDTSRPLGESMYSSAMSQPDPAPTAAAAADDDVTPADPDALQEEEEEEDSNSGPDDVAPLRERQEAVDAEDLSVNTWPLPIPPPHSSVNQMLCASQTLDAVTLTPVVVPPPVLPDPLLPPPTLYSPRSEALYLAEDPSPPACDPYEPHQPRVHLNVSSGLSRSAGSASSAFETYNPRPSNALQPRGQGGITEGLVKGALSVAASAYKALFTGPNCSIQRGIDPATRQDPSLMAMLLEMGFRDQRLNQRLLRKHGYSLLHTVNELVQIAEDNQSKAVNAPH